MLYCESDVHLLKEGCLTFKRLFEAKTGFNLFEHMTIASACNRDLHMNRMIPNSIASEPVGGWRNRFNQLWVAVEWLNWRDHQLRQEALEQLNHEDLEAHDLMMARAYPDHPHPTQRHYIQHVGNTGEYRVPGTTFTVRDEAHLRLCDRTMEDVYNKTQQKMWQLHTKGYNVKEMWEC